MRPVLDVNDSPNIRGIKLGMTKAEVEAALGIKISLSPSRTFLRITKDNREYENLSFLFTDSISKKMLLVFEHTLTTFDKEKMIRDIEENPALSRIDKEAQKSFISLKFVQDGFKPELSIYVPDDLLYYATLSVIRLKRIKMLRDIKKIRFSFFNGKLYEFTIDYDNKDVLPTSYKAIFESLNISKEIIPNDSILSCNGFRINLSLLQFDAMEGNYARFSDGVEISIVNSETESLLEHRAKQKLIETYKNIKAKENVGKKPFKP